MMIRLLKNLLLQFIFHVLLFVFVYKSMNNQDMYDQVRRYIAQSDVERVLRTIVKGEAGQMIQARVAGAPQLFLNERYSAWQIDHRTYMIPPMFTSKDSSYGIVNQQFSSYTDKHDESTLYDLIKQLGESKGIGMFVIHGFELKEMVMWNKVCRIQQHTGPTILSEVDEITASGSDFMIFHHTLGIIFIEVVDSNVADAQRQIQSSSDYIAKLGNSTQTIFHLPQKKIIAMPSTDRSEFDRGSFLENDILLLLADDVRNIESFEKWWTETVETPPNIGTTVPQDYELALSYTLMMRHLGPVIETDSTTYIHQLLVSRRHSRKIPDSKVIEKEYPSFWNWIWDVLDKKDMSYDFGEGKPDRLLKEFMEEHQIMNGGELGSLMGIELLNELLEQTKYILGDMPSMVDEVIATIFDNTFFLFSKNILRFIDKMQQVRHQIEQQRATKPSTMLEDFPFLNVESLEDLNKLDRHLAKFSFIGGESASEVDQELFRALTCHVRVKHSRLPMVMTSQQLTVFEGPLKQLIIGPPGSGKTELMKFKALQLEIEMEPCKEKYKIMYIVANGSPERESLLFYHIKDFFRSTNVEVISVVLQEENRNQMEHSKSILREKMASGQYGHVFIDEYWIGSKPDEHEIILELIGRIPGYVWISSVFSYNQDLMEVKEKMKVRTKPLLDALHKANGIISYITEVMRGTNNIIDVEREYSKMYQQRTYPYGTNQIFNHSLQGLPVTWVAVDGVDKMYSECVEVIENITKNKYMSSEDLILEYDDVLIVNFAIRTEESFRLEESLREKLQKADIPIWTFGQSPEQLMNCSMGKVTLLEAFTREISTYLDGVEWPLVVVILPSGLILKTAKLAEGARELRNYDPYISFFRAMVKLVVISEKWKNSTDFFSDIAKRLN